MTGPEALRRDVLRRVRYATNTLAIEENRVPPEAPFDDALTNGLAAIVTDEWPGEEMADSGRIRPASGLLNVVEQNGGLACVDAELLREALRLTQPHRHGRADDEWAVITAHHIAALRALDAHPALRFLEKARGQSIDACLLAAYYECALDALPFDPKDRLDTPDPDECDVCGRTTFLPSSWDDFGGTYTTGHCVACGHVRDEDTAYDLAASEALRLRLDDGR